MELIKRTFKSCSRLFLEDTFNLIDIEEISFLSEWIEKSNNYDIDEYEKRIINHLQPILKYRLDDWNEIELTQHFIAPLFSIINFNTKTYGMFSERLIKAVIGEYELSGEPDSIIAKGRRVPKIPYVCFHEYKKELDNQGDPQGQCLAAMMVAQELNNNERPIYGIVVKGQIWSFVVLKGKEYAISTSYKATDEELYEIVKLLKHLKTIIEEYVKS